MNITIKDLYGKVYSFDMEEKDTVLHLMAKIMNQEGIPIDQQRLVFSGKQLEDARLLTDYGIEDKSVVHLVLRLRGD